MNGKQWMIKVNDLTIIHNVGKYEWVGCGLTTAPGTASNYTPCESGQSPIYASEKALASDLAAGKVPVGNTVIYDNEPWALTPQVEQQNPALYERLAVQVSHSHGNKIMVAPFGHSIKAIISNDLSAARAGADIIDEQFQTLNTAPRPNARVVRIDTAAIRAANPHTLVLAGLSTDAGGTPTPAGDLYQVYKATFSVVDGYWFNANPWQSHAEGCASKGCPLVAEAFFQRIHVFP
jgi:hypothetical protein